MTATVSQAPSAVAGAVAARLAADQQRRRHSAAFAGAAVASVVVVQLALSSVGGFPESWTIGLDGWIDDLRRWVISNQNTHWSFSAIFNPISDSIDWGLRTAESFVLWVPWYVVVLAGATLTTMAMGLRAGLFAAVGVLYFGAVDLWEPSLQTLALMTVAVTISVAIAVPTGIAAARFARLDRILRPILDAMQTMPAFVYLIPVVLLFGVARVPSVIAAVIYALPPLVRLTALGIRQVPRSTVEASEMFGATPGQTLRKVQLPQALPSVLAGVNQTIMMALSIVVIAALIGAGGLGQEVLESLRRQFVGRALEAGMAVVVMAIMMDRLSSAAAGLGRPRGRTRLVPVAWAALPVFARVEEILEGADQWLRRAGAMLARPLAAVLGHRPETDDIGTRTAAAALGAAALRRPRRVLAAAVLLGGLIVGVYKNWRTFPSFIRFSYADVVDSVVDWAKVNLYEIADGPIGTGPFSDFITVRAVLPLRELFSADLAWPVVVLAVALAAWRLGGPSLAAFCSSCVLGLGVLGMWELSMDTLAQTIVALVMAILCGIPLGVLAARNDTFERVLKPVLDFLQTIPSFVLLVPVIVLFNVGRIPGIIASVLYALPAATRLTNLGIRQVEGEATEASRAFGATRGQTLRKVQVPLAMPSIIAGINQTVMLVLAMVVIAGLVGGGGLGLEAVKGLRRSDSVGSGFVAGVAIVLLAMLLDRLLHAWTQRVAPAKAND